MPPLPITPPAKARVDAGPPSSSPPTGSGGGDFAALLDQTTARTAPAEGQQPRTSQREPAPRRDDDAAPAQAPAATDPAPPVAAAAPGDTAPPAAEPAADAQGQPAADAQTATAAALALMLPAPAAPPVAATTPAVSQPQPAIAPAVAAGPPVTGPVAAPADPASPAAADAGPPAGPLQIPAELLTAKGGRLEHLKDLQVPGGQDALPPAPTLPPSANAAAATATAAAASGAGDGSANADPDPDAGAGAQPQAPSAPPAVAAAQPSAAPQGTVPSAAGAPQLTRGAVVQTAERVHELVRIATSRAGGARATLQLKPEALGQVDVQLRTTRRGLVATIAAHDQAGLDALQGAAVELRRTLADRGVELHSLDLQLSSGGGFGAQGDAREASSGRSGSATTYGLDDGEDAVDEIELTITTPTSTPAGALVDVTA